jgi:predicted O-methyltransferase YrrM
MKEKIKNAIKKIPPIGSISQYLYWRKHLSNLKEDCPRGHFYSPLPDVQWVKSHAHLLYNEDESFLSDIDIRQDFQKSLFNQFARFFPEFNFPKEKQDGYRYYSNNTMFGFGSGAILYAAIRHFMPRQIIEIGSGFTSALMLDTNEKHMNGRIQMTFIEPYPQRLFELLSEHDKTTCRIYEKPVQEIPLACFEELRENDLLFIDSSHVSKIGSDVNHIFFHILPLLSPGVIVHFHDIYWPFEYPLAWLESGRAWNEAYLLRAFLQYNNQFEILLSNNYIEKKHSQLLDPHANKIPGIGSSFWIRKKNS